ncbi:MULTISPECIES: hypothetical protein [Delftia]|uniref:hypothetical protein n=1 Tax=Delftia TaxID=80865 RepID=UPI00190055F3|nr:MULTISPECIES: hypothetical protein [unclassified Delftia]MBK0110563.1 hypothetical protein [Delftia sp. S65]MBK0117227.1 hypothetical protein [Delftia sp. S67]MBK0129022.1 hypothetical protein [Delftia sp. S66]
MLLQKTAKALEELQPGRRSLPLRERSVLLMADGRTEEQLQQVLGAQAGELIEQLIASGHLQRLAGQAAASPPQAPSMAPAAAKESSPPGPAATLNLAGTRMYLFDMCERMFANRHEDKAQVLRHLLREARDLEALQAAALQLLQTVQEHAGDERADALRERLRHLLPQEAATAQGA